jgi:hypothetical protein
MYVFVSPACQPVVAQVTVSPAAAQTQPRQLNRRDFIRLMGIVGAASFLAMNNALKSDSLTAAAGLSAENELTEEEQIKLLVQKMLDEQAALEAGQQTQATQPSDVNPIVTPEATPTVQTQSFQQNTQTNTCVIRCNRGCSAPGRCRRFTDSNGDNRCDLSECA